MGLYVGLDVSLKRTAVCVLDEMERVEWEDLWRLIQSTSPWFEGGKDRDDGAIQHRRRREP